MNLSEMTLEEKIGQLFVTGFAETDMTEEFLELVRKRKVGNVILFQHNVSSESQLKDLTKRIEEYVYANTHIPPFICADEEGGVVSKLPKTCPIMPSAMAQGRLGDKLAIYRGAKVTAKALKSLGINFNLAPVLDINCNHKNPVIGIRSYGERAESVSTMARESIRGYMEENLLCTGKHFPGHGDTGVDSHKGLPELTVDYETLYERELIPFQDAIRMGIPCLTIAHILVPAIEPDKIPCTMSEKVITDFLKGKMKFTGMIISDCMEMDAIRACYGTEKGTVAALNAGVDLIFISHTSAVVESTICEIYRALDSGALRMERIDEAVKKILEMKQKYLQPSIQMQVINDCDIAFAADYYKRAIEVQGNPKTFQIDDNTRFISIKPSSPTQIAELGVKDSFSKILQKHYGGVEVTLDKEPSKEELENVRHILMHASGIVAATMNACLYKQQLELLNLLKEYEIPIVHIALHNPYDLSYSHAAVKIAVYEYTYRAAEAIMLLF